MAQAINIKSMSVDPALLDLPWNIPLEQWPPEVLAALPRGISRHIVRFVNLNSNVIAVKEISSFVADREYEMLRDLLRLGAPCVRPIAVITGRVDANGEELNSVLITEHLSYSLPYRALFSQYMRPETATRLIDALAVLLVRLHLLGFFWGDVSLSNTLFRRDAGAFAAYLVDAETGELHPEGLTSGKRMYDIELARTNIIGELMDLQAGGLLEEDVDTIGVGDRIVSRYLELWDVLTGEESFSMSERWRVANRIERLNSLGFDVGELSMTTDLDGTHLSIQPKVVDAGHYHRQIMRLTGLDVQEGQGRRMLNDLEAYRSLWNRKDEPLEIAAHAWLADVFEPTIAAVPPEMRRKLEPAEIFHEVLEHRWYMSEAAGYDVSMQDAVADYVANVLSNRPDEHSVISGNEQLRPSVLDDIDYATGTSDEDDAEFAARDQEAVEEYSVNPMGFTANLKFKGE
jgi:Lipopolysaccharide kinase (Kdo/WaaP) family.